MRSRSPDLIPVLILTSLLFAPVLGEIQEWSALSIPPRSVAYQGSVMFKNGEMPHWLTDSDSPGQLKAHVQLAYLQSKSGGAQVGFDYRVIALHYTDAHRIGYDELDNDTPNPFKRTYCCSEYGTSSDTNICAVVDALTHTDLLNSSISMWKLQSSAGDTSIIKTPVLRDYRYDVHRSGVHFFLIANCDSKEQSKDIVVSAELVWQHPYGFMPADLTGFLPLYETSFFVFIVAGIIWVSVLFFRRQYVSGVHIFLTTVFALSFFSIIMEGALLERENETGQAATVLYIFKEVIQLVRSCLAVMLTLAMAAGVWVAQPFTDTIRYQTILVGCIYTLMCLGLYAAFPERTPLAIFDSATFLAIIVAVVFMGWLFFFMSFKYTQLKIRGLMGASGSEGPLSMFRRLRLLVLVTAVASVLICFSVFLLDRSNHGWSTWWVFDAEWQVLDTAVLFLAMWICTPRRYDFEFFSTLPSQGFAIPDSADLYSYSSISSTHSVHTPSPSAPTAAKSVTNIRPLRPLETSLLKDAAMDHHDQL